MKKYAVLLIVLIFGSNGVFGFDFNSFFKKNINQQEKNGSGIKNGKKKNPPKLRK